MQTQKAPSSLPTQQWVTKLRSLLGVTLTPIIKNVADYLTSEAMLIWVDAFTHETINKENNYEDLEFLGDAILKGVFSKYLTIRFPDHHKKEYTEWNASYMSKTFNRELSKKMGFGPYIRSSQDKASYNLEADVFESFFGALDTVSDLVVPGIGFSNCYNMVVYLFQDVDITEKKAIGAPKTIVQQIFNRFALPKLVEISQGYRIEINTTPKLNKALGITQNTKFFSKEATKREEAACDVNSQLVDFMQKQGFLTIIEKNNNKYKDNTQQKKSQFQIILAPEQLEFLKTHGIKTQKIKEEFFKYPGQEIFLRSHGIDSKSLDPGTLAIRESTTKTAAENDAYLQAQTILESIGVTTQWAEETKRQQDFMDPEMQILLPNANKKLKERGYISMSFFVSRKTSNNTGSIIQLLGHKKNNKTDVLAQINTQENANSFKIPKLKLVQEFISS